MAKPKESEKKLVYGLLWNPLVPQPFIELHMIRNGGRWKGKKGKMVGEGLAFHYKEFAKCVWKHVKWHKWNELLYENYAKHRFVGVLGPAASGKTHTSAMFALTTYYAFSDCMTIICTSTELERLEERVWGEIKAHHKIAKAEFDWLPGNNIDSRHRIVTDGRYENVDGRDFKNGIVGVPCKKGGTYVGLSSYVGVHNKYIMLVADEGSLMPVVFVNAISNLNKNQNFKAIVMGNPADTTDALGKFCEPSAELGGWDGGIDQTGITKVWPTRWPDGVCVQLVGSDCPNMDVHEELPVPYPFLITRKAIETDIAFYGKDSVQFTMMNEGRMPRGQASSRIITRHMCLKFGALEEPVWIEQKRTKIAFMDAAYARQGGDRTVFGTLEFGKGLDKDGKEIQIISLIGTMLVPIIANSEEMVEDQIANFVKNQCEIEGIPPSHLYFDSTGRGSLMGSFARLWGPNINGIEFGARATERPVSSVISTMCKDYYFNFVSELWYSFRLCIEAGQFRNLSKEIMDEACYREFGRVSGDKKIQVEPKEKMKEKSGRSPDLVDALVCGIEGARRRGFVIAKLSNRVAMEDEHRWKQELKYRSKEFNKIGTLDYSV